MTGSHVVNFLSLNAQESPTDEGDKHHSTKALHLYLGREDGNMSTRTRALLQAST